MGLVQVKTHTVTQGNESQTIKLESCITTDDTYVLVCNNLSVAANGGICDVKPLVDSTSDDTSNIGIAWADYKTDAEFQEFGNTNQDIARATDGMALAPGQCNFIMYLYNWNSSSEYSYFFMNVTSFTDSKLRGYQQNGVKKETTSYNGIQIYTNQATSPAGFQAGSQFTLYKET
jgi:hypothetical protein